MTKHLMLDMTPEQKKEIDDLYDDCSLFAWSCGLCGKMNSGPVALLGNAYSYKALNPGNAGKYEVIKVCGGCHNAINLAVNERRRTL